jgi:hypothetical protein
VNPVYGKLPVNRKLRSRKTQLSILDTRDTNLACVGLGARCVSKVVDLIYIEGQCSGTSKVNPVYSKMPVEKGFMLSQDAKKLYLVYITRDTKVACVKSGQYSGVSKVNLGCGKVPVNRKLCSRETRKLL